jgi:hypothetical protein
MLSTIQTPAGVGTIISKRAVVADLSQCETFGPAVGGVERLMCTAPVVHDGATYAAALLRGGSPDVRELLKARLEEVLKASGFSFPGTRMVSDAGTMALLVPWAYRGEFRAIFSSAVGAWSPDTVRRDDDQIGRSLAGASSFAALPDEVSGLDLARFKTQLFQFALAFEGPLQGLLRRLVGKPANRRWVFPLGCVIVESRSQAGTEWEISFENFEFLERAFVLVDAVIAKRAEEGGTLRMGHVRLLDEDDGEPTATPALRVASNDNSRSTRVEMGRLVKDVILMLVNYSNAQSTDF